MDDLVAGKVLPNRLEQLLIHPVPTTTHHSFVHMGPQRRFQEEKHRAEELLNMADARVQFENIASTGSVVLPHPDDYTPLMSYSDSDRHIILSSLVHRLSRENSNSRCTILVAGCKNFQARRYRTDDRPVTVSKPLRAVCVETV